MRVFPHKFCWTGRLVGLSLMLCFLPLSALNAQVSDGGRIVVAQAQGGEGRRITQNCGDASATLVGLPGGLSRINIASVCRAYTVVEIEYGGWSARYFLDGAGKLETVIDCFAGDAVPVQISFQDGFRLSKKVVSRDLKKVSKVAVIWSAEVNLDLHALEFGSLLGGKGHVWSGASSDQRAAKAGARKSNAGKGFMSTLEQRDAQGARLEVYTFWHGRRNRSGVVKMIADYQSRGSIPRGEFCGSGRLAEVPFETVVMVRNRVESRVRGGFAAAPCNVPLAEAARYNSKTIPDLLVRN